MTIAVDDSARPAPSTTADGSGSPSASAAAPMTKAVSTNWAVPRPNTSLRKSLRRLKLRSRPIENSRNTTPNSASVRVPSMSLIMPKA